MSNHIEHGHARGALYTLRQADIHEAGDYHEQRHRPDERFCAPVFVLDLTNDSGDGLSLTGSRRELLEYLELVITHVRRETDPLPALDLALAQLAALRIQRAAAWHTADQATLNHLDDQRARLLEDVAAAAEAVND